MNNVLRGKLGFKGERGYSAYEIAVQNGFIGSEKDWLAQLGTSSHFDRDIVIYTMTEGQTEFDIPSSYVSGSFMDIYVEGERLSSNEYTLNTDTNKIVLTNAIAVESTEVEIVVVTMATSNLLVNIKNYGAIGDGVADDTESIQKAIDETNNIYIPDGIYNFTELTIASNKNIYGCQNSVLRGKTIKITGDNNRISYIKYDGNLDSDGIDVTGNHNTIENCEIYNIKNNDGKLGRGIDVRGCKYITIKDCYFHDLMSGNENAEVGLDEGSIRAIRTHEADFINIHNNKFESMSGLKDGDYIHIQSGSLGEKDDSFPYNGTNRASLNEIKIYDNTFVQKTCKSCIKVQCSDVSIYNNRFVLNNETDSHYAVIRVQMGDRNNIYDNEFKVESGTANYNHIILMEYTANNNIKNNIFDVDITESVNANSSQNIIQLQKVKNIRITNNNFNLKDLRYILYFDSVNEVAVKDNTFKGVFTNSNPTLLRVLDQNNHVSNRIHFENNFYEEVISGTLTTKQSFVQINPVNGIHIVRNKFVLNKNYIFFYFDNSINVVFNENEISNASSETLHYPIAFGSGCSNLDVKNNANNLATAFIKLNATVSNLHFTANGDFEEAECVSIYSGQDYNELHYYKSDNVSMNYDFGYGARAVKYQNGHTFYNRNLKKLLTYYSGTWYVDGSEYTES